MTKSVSEYNIIEYNIIKEVAIVFVVVAVLFLLLLLFWGGGGVAFMYVCVLHVCLVPRETRRGRQMGVNHSVSTGETMIFQKNSQCS